MESRDQNSIKEFERKILDLREKLNRTQKEKRQISDDLNSLKIQFKKSKQKNEISSVQNDQTLIKNQIENEISNFSEFISGLSFHLDPAGTHDAFQTINHIANDPHLKINDKISPFFTALKSIIVSAISQSRKLNTQDLEDTRTMIEDANNQNQNLIDQITELSKKNEIYEEIIDSLRKQIRNEHKMLANFASHFDSSAKTIKLSEDETFVRRQLEILSDAVLFDYSQFQELIEKDFGKYQSKGQITLPDLLEFSFSKFQEVDHFIQKLYDALEVDTDDTNFNQLLTILQDHLSVIPKLQNSITQLKAEKEVIQNHCNEMEHIVQKQSQDFSRSHKSIVQRLQQQIKELQSRCNDERLEELTQIISEKDTENKDMRKKLQEYEQNESKHLKLIGQLQSDLITQKDLYSELNEKYENYKQKQATENDEIFDLRNQIKERDLKLRDLEDDFNDQISDLSMTNQQLRYKLNTDQSTEIKELQKLSERSVHDLKNLQKKSKKYKSQLVETKKYSRELESKYSEMTEFQKIQSRKINSLQNKLSKAKSALSKISEEYGSFQQAHLKAIAKLNESQSQAKLLTKQNKLITKQLEESQATLENFQNTSCSKEELERVYLEVQSKDKSIKELKTLISKQESVIATFESRQPILEQFKEKYDEEHELLRLRDVFVANVSNITKDIHEYLTSIFQNRATAGLQLINIIQKSKPLFDAFALPIISFDFVRPITLNLTSNRVANIRPNPDLEMFTTQNKSILSRIVDELSEFSLDKEAALESINESLSLTDKLNNILDLSISARRVFDEKNESLSALSSLVKNQHTAIVRMSRVSSPKSSSPKK